MTPLDILSTIRQAGGSVVVEDGDLQIKVPMGILTQEHKAVLVEHKAVLVRLLAPDQADPERTAIQWVEGLSPVEAAVVVETAFREWAEIVGTDQHGDQEPAVIRAEINGDELRLHCPTPELAEKIEAGRSHIEQVLVEISTSIDEDTGSDPWEAGVDPPEPCGRCGSLKLWQTFAGSWRCCYCEPSTRAERVAATASRLRRSTKRGSG